jgi:amino acid transporter
VKLNQFLATGICGNDILGSCLYAAGLVAVPAGRWAPVCFFLVGALLYFFRWIYQEVGQALPVNGGTYTLLLNTSSKQIAAFAGSLTLLSYVATAVVSANSAMHYLRELWPDLQVYSAVVLLLFVFAVINLVGIRESAYNALLIFAIHLVTLLVFLAACLARVIDDGGVTLMANLATPPDQGDFFALAYGFCVALLGVTGFETSANYIEAQARGVYPRVLRNVCVLVIVVNPLISLLSMGVLPQDLVPGIKNHLVSSAAYAAQGRWLHVLVTLDAVLVLSGSVLTAFIGVQGLAYRMALDGCLPRALTSLSHMRGTQHVSVLAFFLVAVSLHVLCDADIRVLSGVYTLSFVALLVCFVFGNIWLNVSRAALPRESASRAAVAVALIGTVFGLLGTAYSQPDMAMYAVVYVGAVFAVVLACLYWLLILRGAASVLSVLGVGLGSRMKLVEQIAREQHKGIVFFLQNETNDDLRQVCRYVLANEERRLLKIVKVTSEPLSPAELVRSCVKLAYRRADRRLQFHCFSYHRCFLCFF